MIVVPKPRGRPRKVPTIANPTLTLATCVDIVKQSMQSRREALRTEVAVGLGLFYETGRVSRESKDMLTQVYARSGYDCLNINSKDYKTINRRVNNTAALFDRLGYNRIKERIGNATEYVLIANLREEITELKIDSMESLLNYCGKNPRKLAVREPDGFISESPVRNRLRIDTGRIHLTIPSGASPAELMEFAHRVMAMAKELEQELKEHPEMSVEEAGSALSQIQYGGDEPPGEVQEADLNIVPDTMVAERATISLKK